jgi:hypothetical protein
LVIIYLVVFERNNQDWEKVPSSLLCNSSGVPKKEKLLKSSGLAPRIPLSVMIYARLSESRVKNQYSVDVIRVMMEL